LKLARLIFRFISEACQILISSCSIRSFCLSSKGLVICWIVLVFSFIGLYHSVSFLVGCC